MGDVTGNQIWKHIGRHVRQADARARLACLENRVRYRHVLELFGFKKGVSVIKAGEERHSRSYHQAAGT